MRTAESGDTLLRLAGQRSLPSAKNMQQQMSNDMIRRAASKSTDDVLIKTVLISA
jgi:hypothetical protein